MIPIVIAAIWWPMCVRIDKWWTSDRRWAAVAKKRGLW